MGVCLRGKKPELIDNKSIKSGKGATGSIIEETYAKRFILEQSLQSTLFITNP